MFRKTISIVAVMALLLSNAQGASLTNIQGAVTVSTGNGFIQVFDGAAVAPGALVRTSEGGTANIVYDNGCVVQVAPRQVVAVADAPPSCQTGVFDFSPTLPDVSAGEILTDLAVVAGAVAIAIAIAAKTKPAGGP
jgi:hypothetical protein